MVPVDGYLLARYGIFDTSRPAEESTMFVQPLHELSAEDREDLHDFACCLYGFAPIDEAVRTARDTTDKAERSLDMANKIVFQVVTCLGDQIGTIEVEEQGDEMATANEAYRLFREQYGPYRSCGQCGDASLSLQDPRDSEEEPYDPEADEGLIDEA